MSEAEDAKRIQDELMRLKKAGIDDATARILTLLEEARRQVLADVADTDWERFYLPRLSNAIDRQLQHFRDLAAAGLSADQADLWGLGAQGVLDTAAAIGVAVALPEIPTSLLQAMQAEAGRRIGNLAQAAKAQIDLELGSLLLAGKPREDAIAAIGRSLVAGTPPGMKPEGMFGTVAARARFITQQELGATYATAQDLRRDQVVAHAPDLQKVWVHDGHPLRPRPDHVAMHGETRDQTEPFSNGLMFPRDPDGDISETAGCTCDTFLWQPDFGSLDQFIGPATGEMAA
jgi:hypothetical protein